MADHNIVTARWPITPSSPKTTSRHTTRTEARRGGAPRSTITSCKNKKKLDILSERVVSLLAYAHPPPSSPTRRPRLPPPASRPLTTDHSSPHLAAYQPSSPTSLPSSLPSSPRHPPLPHRLASPPSTHHYVHLIFIHPPLRNNHHHETHTHSFKPMQSCTLGWGRRRAEATGGTEATGGAGVGGRRGVR